ELRAGMRVVADATGIAAADGEGEEGGEWRNEGAVVGRHEGPRRECKEYSEANLLNFLDSPVGSVNAGLRPSLGQLGTTVLRWEACSGPVSEGPLALIHHGGLVGVVRLGAALDGVVGLLDLLVDDVLERLDGLGPGEVAAVDEERGGAAHAHLRQGLHPLG